MINTYGEMLKEAKREPLALMLLNLWIDRKIPLYPAIDLYNQIKKNAQHGDKWLKI